MEKTITIKGVGSISAIPDYVVISMFVDSDGKEYDEAIEIAKNKMEQLTETLVSVGFEKTDIKTISFFASAKTKTDRGQDGFLEDVFCGFRVSHYIKVEFSFEPQRLSDMLSAISKCEVKPVLSVDFTVKDSFAINEKMLKAVAADARKKAETLCEELNVELPK